MCMWIKARLRIIYIPVQRHFLAFSAWITRWHHSAYRTSSELWNLLLCLSRCKYTVTLTRTLSIDDDYQLRHSNFILGLVTLDFPIYYQFAQRIAATPLGGISRTPSQQPFPLINSRRAASPAKSYPIAASCCDSRYRDICFSEQSFNEQKTSQQLVSKSLFVVLRHPDTTSCNLHVETCEVRDVASSPHGENVAVKFLF